MSELWPCFIHEVISNDVTWCLSAMTFLTGKGFLQLAIAGKPAPQRAATPSARRAAKAVSPAEFEDMYQLDLEKKIECLRNFNRVQWNSQITQNLSNADATETWILILGFY